MLDSKGFKIVGFSVLCSNIKAKIKVGYGMRGNEITSLIKIIAGNETHHPSPVRVSTSSEPRAHPSQRTLDSLRQ
jgi:hypothetical protein